MVMVKAKVAVQSPALQLSTLLDAAVDLAGRSFLLQLLSTDLLHPGGPEKEAVAGYVGRRGGGGEAGTVLYEGSFEVAGDFGPIGAVLLTNEHHSEVLLRSVVLEKDGELTYFTCNSWVQPRSLSPAGRVFFADDQCCLPEKTPGGLRRLRRWDLEMKRGDGAGQRKESDRIYDYDVYNDLGDPDGGNPRPVLGGSLQFPYPRRCRTGRPRSSKDPSSETKAAGSGYIPRDEQFSDVKKLQFAGTTLKAALGALVPSAESAVVAMGEGFASFEAIDSLYVEGLRLPLVEGLDCWRSFIPRLALLISQGPNFVLRFQTPELIKRDHFSWLKDEEFARETLAGTNPYVIELLKEFPLKSKLDPLTYGPAESAITGEILEKQMNHLMSITEALERKRLFILDYHDLFLPYVHKVRASEGTTLYASRTVFFLRDDGTLKPLAIELTRPQSPSGQPQWKSVFTPSSDATASWLWRLAKAHVAAHDSGYHELISHWLRTHCCIEPYIIAANRQLSVMHPIYLLLSPHFRYTMQINALARQALINAGGIIESSFSPLRYSMELSSAAYAQLWRFDMEGLPADLLRRGMAIRDPEAEHGLRLTVPDYPFASDGLLIWSAIRQWVEDYVTIFYTGPESVASDEELQRWWEEVRTRGHADKRNEPWWPRLKDAESLAHTLTTIIWVASAHHAAVNFGQYHFAGYFPNRPTIARTNMPTEDGGDPGLGAFLEDPGAELLRCFPSQMQAAVVMAVLDLLSTHSPDEEYLGGLRSGVMRQAEAAYRRFAGRLTEIHGIIDSRNEDVRLKNRVGAGVVPYELLKPFSSEGLTGRGIPNSTSI